MYIFQDGIGDLFADSDTKIYWVSFLDGMQRVLLFTQDLALATIAQEVKRDWGGDEGGDDVGGKGGGDGKHAMCEHQYHHHHHIII
jgi:hypothetical protein